jgi:hypothetical protein
MPDFTVTSSVYWVSISPMDCKANKELFQSQWRKRWIKLIFHPSINISHKTECITCKFRSMTFSLLVVQLPHLASTFNPFRSLCFPLRGHGWRGKGRNSDVIHHCNRRYRLAKRQTCRSFQRTLFMQKANTHIKLKYIPGQETTL